MRLGRALFAVQKAEIAKSAEKPKPSNPKKGAA